MRRASSLWAGGAVLLLAGLVQAGAMWATREKVRRGSSARAFDAARAKMHAWEKAHPHRRPPSP